MSFKEDVADLARRAISAQAIAQTEEATKNAIVMPFLRVLGFDVFDPVQVIPEFVADIGLKKGEKIDYAVKIGDRIEYLVEAKSVSTNLRDAQYSQLFRYFHTCDANIAVLTNGLQFWFFTDLEAPNKMDANPFFKFDLLGYDDNDLRELEKFHKANFSIENIQAAAASLKYLRGAKGFIERQWAEPDDEFVKMVARDFYEGQLRGPVIESLKPIVKRAFDDLFRQRARQRIDDAFDGESLGFGSRAAGDPVRRKLANLLNMSPNGKLTVDMSGVALVSSSYADEVFGKLFVELGPLEFMKRVEVIRVDPLVRNLIDRAIVQRTTAS